jgi:hypothetical protein
MTKYRRTAATSNDRIQVEEYAGSIPKDVKLLSSMFHVGKSLSQMAAMLYGINDATHKAKVNRELRKAIIAYPALFGTVKPPERANTPEFHVMVNGAVTKNTHYQVETAIQEAQKLSGELHLPVLILRAVGIVKPTDIVITETTLSLGATDQDEFLGI